MRVSRAAWICILTSSAAFTDAFTSPNYLSIPTRLTATIEAASETEPTVAPSSFHDIQNLPYRQLQRHCKSVGLEAVGPTAVLRTRLLSHYGLMRVNKFESSEEETSQEVEVGIIRSLELCVLLLNISYELNFVSPKTVDYQIISLGTLCH